MLLCGGKAAEILGPQLAAGADELELCAGRLCTWNIHTILTYLKMLMAVRV